MRMPLDVPLAGPTYVHLMTVSWHFGAETKTKNVDGSSTTSSVFNISIYLMTSSVYAIPASSCC